MKFKVGDRVVANVWANGKYFWTSNGWEGKVEEILDHPHPHGDMIVSGKGMFYEEERFLVWSEYFTLKKSEKPKTDGKPKRTVIIEITDDGADAKYLNGKKVEKKASIKRYYKDKPDDKYAAVYAVCKLFGMNASELKNDRTISAQEIDDIDETLMEAMDRLCDVKDTLKKIMAAGR